MKKTFLSILFTLILLPLFAQEIPDELKGIWDGRDRYVFFDEVDDKNEIAVCLKEYYGWWIDRTVEPEKYKNEYKRQRNAGTKKDAVQLDVAVNKIILKNSDVLCFELKIVYSSSQISYIPVCIYKNNIYLNFYVQSTENPSVYTGNAVSKGFLVSEQIIPENIGCLFVDQNKVYDIRYWKSDMDFSNENAKFNLDDVTFEVPKHIFTQNQNYSCVNGRSKTIRNPHKPRVYNEDELFFTEDRSVLIMDKTPYMTKLVDNSSYSDLIQIINKNNSKKKPEPGELFVHHSIEWYLEIIDELEMNEDYIHKIREKFDTRNRSK